MSATETEPDYDEIIKKFHVFTPELQDDPHPVMEEMRSRCPVAHSELHGGYWVVTTYDDVRTVLSDPDTFSNARGRTIPEFDDGLGAQIPLGIDPPELSYYRRVLAPLFAPTVIARREDDARALARNLLTAFAAKGGGDFVAKYAVPFAAQVFLTMYGLPLSDMDQLLAHKNEYVHKALSGDDELRERFTQGSQRQFLAYFAEKLAERRQMDEMPDDVLTGLITQELDGRRLTDDEILRASKMLVVAGLDTVTASISNYIMFLASSPGHRQQLIEDPAITNSAVEELLRYWGIVTTGRTVMKPTTLRGVDMQPGDFVLLPLVSTGRDASAFEDVDTVDFARKGNRHLAFGLGPHRCLGSHLARMGLRVTLEEVHQVMPNYEIAADQPLEKYFTNQMGMRQLYLNVV